MPDIYKAQTEPDRKFIETESHRAAYIRARFDAGDLTAGELIDGIRLSYDVYLQLFRLARAAVMRDELEKELYKALEMAASSAGFQYMVRGTREVIEDALAKARGEQE
jgi:hypothetical protein